MFASPTRNLLTQSPTLSGIAHWGHISNAQAFRPRSGQVYELYFPEELHAAGLRLFEMVGQAFLPAVPPNLTDKIVCATFLSTLRKKFEEVYDIEHPLRAALDKLQTLETVRIIEGKE